MPKFKGGMPGVKVYTFMNANYTFLNKIFLLLYFLFLYFFVYSFEIIISMKSVLP